MRNALLSYLYLRYGSSNGSLLLQGAAAPGYPDYTSSKLKLVFRRKEELLPGEGELLNAAERNFFSRHVDLGHDKTAVLHTSHAQVVETLNKNTDAIINLNRLNDLKSVNTFIREVNGKLPVYGLFGCCVEPKCVRKEKIFTMMPPVFSHVYYFFFFICNRVFAKLGFTAGLYLWLTGGRTKVMSKTEAMGRMYAHGFEIVEEERIGDKVYFVFRKIKKPVIDHIPTYGVIFKMLRKGKNGKLIYVYKMRTMDAYSEYLQQYVYVQNNLDKGGKFKDDFRVTTVGKILRRYWIDELPMLINLLKGDIKLVGVRPLSPHYLSLYSGTLRQKRDRHKPGLLPPFYVDMPKTISEIVASEMRYLHEYERNPLWTDVKYFVRIVYTIVVKRARSK